MHLYGGVRVGGTSLKRWLDDRLYLFYSMVLILHIFNTFLGNDTLQYVVGLLATPILLVSFLGATRLFKILGSVFILLGLSMFFRRIYQLMTYLLFLHRICLISFYCCFTLD